MTEQELYNELKSTGLAEKLSANEIWRRVSEGKTVDELSATEVYDNIVTVAQEDPYTILGLIMDIIKFLHNSGSNVYYGNEYQEDVHFDSNPQLQIDDLVQLCMDLGLEDTAIRKLIDELKLSIAENVKGIAHMNEIKQDKLTANQLANIDAVPNKADYSDIESINNDITDLQNNKANTLDLVPINNNINGLISGKQNKLIAGNNIEIAPNNTISAIIPESSGTTVKIAAVAQAVVNFDSDPQSQLDTMATVTSALESNLNTKASTTYVDTELDKKQPKGQYAQAVELPDGYSANMFTPLNHPTSRHITGKVLNATDIPNAEYGNDGVLELIVYDDTHYVQKWYNGAEIWDRFYDGSFKPWRRLVIGEEIDGVKRLINEKAEIKKLWKGATSARLKLDPSYKQYNFLMIRYKMFLSTLTLFMKAPIYDVVTAAGVVNHQNTQQLLYAVAMENNVNSNEIVITKSGFFNFTLDNKWVDRVTHNAFTITDVYGIKGVQDI